MLFEDENVMMMVVDHLVGWDIQEYVFYCCLGAVGNLVAVEDLHVPLYHYLQTINIEFTITQLLRNYHQTKE